MYFYNIGKWDGNVLFGILFVKFSLEFDLKPIIFDKKE